MQITRLQITNIRRVSESDDWLPNQECQVSVHMEIQQKEGFDGTYTRDLEIDVRAQVTEFSEAPESARLVLLQWAKDLVEALEPAGSLR